MANIHLVDNRRFRKRIDRYTVVVDEYFIGEDEGIELSAQCCL
ncbi:hypothetical protein [Marivirga harenae]|nr:hypothetical protein [Marivirga harenae]WKV10992.1 hypothetical protein Q3Y49_12290 [Marivirga harenae]